MSVLKRLFGRLSGDTAQNETNEEAPPPASCTSVSAAASAAAAPAGSRDAVVHALVTQLVKQSENKLTHDAIDPDAEMCDRGYLDSLTYVAFLVFVEETYGVRILDHQLTVGKLRTVSAVADWVLAESKSAL